MHVFGQFLLKICMFLVYIYCIMFVVLATSPERWPGQQPQVGGAARRQAGVRTLAHGHRRRHHPAQEQRLHSCK